MFRRNFLFSLAAAAALAGTGTGLAILGQEEPDDLVLRVNLPAYELEVWDGDELIRTYPTTIGAPGYNTPTGEYDLDRIVWNPWWHPPDSKWAEGEKDTPPGPGNPMGRAKLRFNGLIYFHGTTNEAHLGQARSHGCIRLANADVLELARLIAERRGVLPADEIDALEANHQATRDIRLEEPVRVVVSYRLVEEVAGEVREYEDVYRRGMRPHERELLQRGSS